MPEPKGDIFVADTTPIISLSCIGYLKLLRQLYSTIFIPQFVHKEIMAGGERYIGVEELRKADWIKVKAITNCTVIMKDYGPPKLSKDFFDKNPVKEVSAARILYSNFFYPELEALALKVVKRLIIRGREEAKKIRREKNPENLLKIMRQHPDPINHLLLKKRILSFSKFTIPKIIEGLKDNRDDTFAELAISIIYRSKIDCSSQLLEILNSIKHPHTLSLVCLLLGFIGLKESIQPVWNCYHFLKRKYPREDYEQGPLLALYELKVRFDLS